MASASEEIRFLIVLKFKQPHEALSYHSGQYSYRGRDQFGEISGPQFSHLSVRGWTLTFYSVKMRNDVTQLTVSK